MYLANSKRNGTVNQNLMNQNVSPEADANFMIVKFKNTFSQT